MIIYLITGLAIGFIIGVVFGFKYSEMMLARYVLDTTTDPEIKKVARKIMGKKEETSYYPQMNEKEALANEENSATSIKKSLGILPSAKEQEDND